jgi:hypothetical protein
VGRESNAVFIEETRKKKKRQKGGGLILISYEGQKSNNQPRKLYHSARRIKRLKK